MLGSLIFVAVIYISISIAIAIFYITILDIDKIKTLKDIVEIAVIFLLCFIGLWFLAFLIDSEKFYI